MTKEHHFEIGLAEKYGVEKAILLHNISFWLEKNKANECNIKELDGKKYYWTYCSADAFTKLFPYFNKKSISRWIKELKDDGVIIIGNFNKNKYDRTGWYTMSNFCINKFKNTENNEEKDLSEFEVSIPQNEALMPQNEAPIPYTNTYNKKETLLKVPVAIATETVKDMEVDAFDKVTIRDSGVDKNSDLEYDDSCKIKNKETNMKYLWVIEYWNKYLTCDNIGIQDKSMVKNKMAINRLLPECRKMTPDLQIAIGKIRAKYNEEEIKKCIQVYIYDILTRSISSDYCEHRFTCYEFFKQENGFRRFANM